MNMNQVTKILKTEKECVERQDTPKCNRDCGNCDLLLPTEEVKQAYTLAIGCIEGTQSLLDDIRAEIELLSNANPSYWHSGDMVEREEVLDIIDKYKAESEGKE